MSISYEKVVALLAGPLAAGIAVVSSVVLKHNVTTDPAVLTAGTVTAGAATLLAHWKWLDGSVKWFQTQEKKLPIDIQSDLHTLGSDAETSALDEINKITAAQSQLQATPGTPAGQVQSGLAPSAPQPTPTSTTVPAPEQQAPGVTPGG